jgi:hypothetical protein
MPTATKQDSNNTRDKRSCKEKGASECVNVNPYDQMSFQSKNKTSEQTNIGERCGNEGIIVLIKWPNNLTHFSR